jgi:hypothetical protein
MRGITDNVQVFEENVVEVAHTRHLVKLPQLGAAFGVGDKGAVCIMPPPA